MSRSLMDFLRESLAIEGIHRDPTLEEIHATDVFLKGDCTVDTVIDLQEVYAPGKPLRIKPTMNVQVGGYVAPRGSQYMREKLAHVLDNADPWSLHVAFEMLHPFMDGNGRAGRAVWAWAMGHAGHDPFSLSFLHRFYYQTLAASRLEEKK